MFWFKKRKKKEFRSLDIFLSVTSDFRPYDENMLSDLGLIEGEESVNFILNFVCKGLRAEGSKFDNPCVEFWRFIVDRRELSCSDGTYTNRYCHSRDEVINLSQDTTASLCPSWVMIRSIHDNPSSSTDLYVTSRSVLHLFIFFENLLGNKKTSTVKENILKGP